MAGMVDTALDAGVNTATIISLGRWSSSAWMSYVLHLPMDSQKAVQAIWARSPARSPVLRVGEFDVRSSLNENDFSMEELLPSV
jgi:hypothetical protein